MYYCSRFAILGLFIVSFFVFSGWNWKGQVGRNVASVAPTTYDYAPHWYAPDKLEPHAPAAQYSPSYKL